jgi:hypothetical protein
LFPARVRIQSFNFEYAIVRQQQSAADVAAVLRAFLGWAVDPAAGNGAAFLDQVHSSPFRITFSTSAGHRSLVLFIGAGHLG